MSDIDAADEEAVKLREEKLRLAREQELSDLKKIINTPEGERFFQRFFEYGYVFQTTFTGNSQGAFLEGHRNMALRYMHDIAECCPEKVASLLVKSEKEDEV
jgi:hypothetical protein